MELNEVGISEWGELLPERGFGVFHTAEALRVLDDHTTGELRLLGGFNGDQAVGLLPVFITRKAGMRFVLSPPTEFGMRELGPVMMPTSPKRRKQEKVNRSFAEAVIDATDAGGRFTVFRMACGPWYGDPRPYRWADFDVGLSFTYCLELASVTAEEVLASFSRSARREVKDGTESDIVVRIGGRSDARRIHAAVQDRYDEQEKGFRLQWGFMSDLVDALGERARVYVAESAAGEFLGGIVVLYSNDTAHFWKGGTRNSHGSASVNTLLHWRIIEDICTDPELEAIDRYDLYSANNEHIARYKSKFGGKLVPYYVIESNSLPMRATKKAYRATYLNDRFLETRARLKETVGLL